MLSSTPLFLRNVHCVEKDLRGKGLMSRSKRRNCAGAALGFHDRKNADLIPRILVLDTARYSDDAKVISSQSIRRFSDFLPIFKRRDHERALFRL